MNIDIRFGDCLNELNKIRSNSIDLVVTDPAYESMMRWAGIGTTARMGMGKKGSGSDNLDDKWFEVFSNDNLPDLVQEIHRVLKPERHAYIMCDWETLKLLHTYAITEGVFAPVGYGGLFEPCKPLILVDDFGEETDRAGLLSPQDAIANILKEFSTMDLEDMEKDDWQKAAKWFTKNLYDLSFNSGADVLVWDKVLAGTGYTYRTVHEYILMLWKGKKRKLKNLGIPDVLRFKKPWGNERVFPTQKPVELFELLITQSTNEGEVVLDPFMGSGTAAIACKNTNRIFIGIEKSEKAVNVAQNRLGITPNDEKQASEQTS